MIVKDICETDFINYKKPAMFIGTTKCSFKCEKECGQRCCQNSKLATSPDIYIDDEKLVQHYMGNELTRAIVIGGLEPFDTFDEVYSLVRAFRRATNDDIVIYSGYNLEEIVEPLLRLQSIPNIIVKFGRYIPGQKKHFDEVLGVELASDNQYGEKIS